MKLIHVYTQTYHPGGWDDPYYQETIENPEDTVWYLQSVYARWAGVDDEYHTDTRDLCDYVAASIRSVFTLVGYTPEELATIKQEMIR